LADDAVGAIVAINELMTGGDISNATLNTQL